MFVSLQVFADGEEPVKKSVDGIYDDDAKEHRVRRKHYVFDSGVQMKHY